MTKTFGAWCRLIRLDRPIGTYLLLWPTLTALWIASDGHPSLKHIVIFTLGSYVMRSAGCAINDFADRKVDGKVERTKARPLAAGELQAKTALLTFIGLSLLALLLVLQTNTKTQLLSIGAAAIAALYPFMKRFTHFPQVVLGAAFCFGMPMAFTAANAELSRYTWLFWLALVLWVVVYDTFYAMVDRSDDIAAGIKSTAVLFGRYDRVITASLQVMVLCLLVIAWQGFGLGGVSYAGIFVVGLMFAYQQWLIRHRERGACFNAFTNNHPALFMMFSAVLLDTSVL